jgi:hypothetical protein
VNTEDNLEAQMAEVELQDFENSGLEVRYFHLLMLMIQCWRQEIVYPESECGEDNMPRSRYKDKMDSGTRKWSIPMEFRSIYCRSGSKKCSYCRMNKKKVFTLAPPLRW